MYYQYVPAPDDFPRAYVLIGADDEGVTELYFVDEKIFVEAKNIHSKQCAKELKEYFNKKRTTFNVALNPQGTEFQRQVWSILKTIPYGEIWSYKDMALTLGSIKYCRAVGMANSRNPISLIVPCHRVIGQNGKLVGYGGGLDVKQWLIDHEKN